MHAPPTHTANSLIYVIFDTLQCNIQQWHTVLQRVQTSQDVLLNMQLQGSELEAAYSLLQLFCYGTWQDYKGAYFNPKGQCSQI